MRKTILFSLLILSLSCKSNSKNEIEITEAQNEIIEEIKEENPKSVALDSIKLNLNFKPQGNYTSIINKVKSDKTYIKQLYETNSAKAIDSASQYIYSKLLNDMVPHWYGTVWDFNGHTNTPNNGEIACGYFVSTTLKHLGFNLNRYKMAQQAGLLEARMLQPKSELKIYSGLSFEALRDKVNAVYKDGLYFIGLDNHVGYVLIKDKVLYFLHSSYCDDKVVVELAEKSPCFISNIYVFAEITTNKNLIKKWIHNQRLNVPNN